MFPELYVGNPTVIQQQLARKRSRLIRQVKLIKSCTSTRFAAPTVTQTWQQQCTPEQRSAGWSPCCHALRDRALCPPQRTDARPVISVCVCVCVCARVCVHSHWRPVSVRFRLVSTCKPQTKSGLISWMSSSTQLGLTWRKALSPSRIDNFFFTPLTLRHLRHCLFKWETLPEPLARSVSWGGAVASGEASSEMRSREFPAAWFNTETDYRRVSTRPEEEAEEVTEKAPSVWQPTDECQPLKRGW